jgi:hypothetical protein
LRCINPMLRMTFSVLEAGQTGPAKYLGEPVLGAHFLDLLDTDSGTAADHGFALKQFIPFHCPRRIAYIGIVLVSLDRRFGCRGAT